MSRSALDKFLLKYVKKYLPTKTPGSKYTGAEFKKAYIEFLNEGSVISEAVKKAFPSKYLKFSDNIRK